MSMMTSHNVRLDPGKMRNRLEFFDQHGSLHPPTGPSFVWGEFRTLTGEGLYIAAQVNQKITAEIRMRYVVLGGMPIIEGYQVVVDENRRYTIDSVVNVDERDEVLILTVYQ